MTWHVLARHGIAVRGPEPERLETGAIPPSCGPGRAGIIDKEAARKYALGTFGSRWRSVIEDALAFWRDTPPAPGRFRRHPLSGAAAFVAHVIDASPGVKDSARGHG